MIRSTVHKPTTACTPVPADVLSPGPPPHHLHHAAAAAAAAAAAVGLGPSVIGQPGPPTMIGPDHPTLRLMAVAAAMAAAAGSTGPPPPPPPPSQSSASSSSLTPAASASTGGGGRIGSGAPGQQGSTATGHSSHHRQQVRGGVSLPPASPPTPGPGELYASFLYSRGQFDRAAMLHLMQQQQQQQQQQRSLMSSASVSMTGDPTVASTSQHHQRHGPFHPASHQPALAALHAGQPYQQHAHLSAAGYPPGAGIMPVPGPAFPSQPSFHHHQRNACSPPALGLSTAAPVGPGFESYSQSLATLSQLSQRLHLQQQQHLRTSSTQQHLPASSRVPVNDLSRQSATMTSSERSSSVVGSSPHADSSSSRTFQRGTSISRQTRLSSNADDDGNDDDRKFSSEGHPYSFDQNDDSPPLQPLHPKAMKAAVGLQHDDGFYQTGPTSLRATREHPQQLFRYRNIDVDTQRLNDEHLQFPHRALNDGSPLTAKRCNPAGASRLDSSTSGIHREKIAKLYKSPAEVLSKPGRTFPFIDVDNNERQSRRRSDDACPSFTDVGRRKSSASPVASRSRGRSSGNDFVTSCRPKDIGPSTGMDSSRAGGRTGRHRRHFVKGSLIRLSSGQLKKVEDLETADFDVGTSMIRDESNEENRSGLKNPDRQKAEDGEPETKRGRREGWVTSSMERMKSSRFWESGIGTRQKLSVAASRVVHVRQNHEKGTAVLGFTVGSAHVHQVSVEAGLDHPFFVCGLGWSSCCPERTLQHYGLVCRQLAVGDTCVSLLRQQQSSSSGRATTHIEALTSTCTDTDDERRNFASSLSERKDIELGVALSRGSESSHVSLERSHDGCSSGRTGGSNDPDIHSNPNTKDVSALITSTGQLVQPDDREMPSKRHLQQAAVNHDSRHSRSSSGGGRKRRWSAPDETPIDNEDETQDDDDGVWRRLQQANDGDRRMNLLRECRGGKMVENSALKGSAAVHDEGTQHDCCNHTVNNNNNNNNNCNKDGRGRDHLSSRNKIK